MKRYKILDPLLYWGKRYVYNIYRRSQLTTPDFPSEIWIESTNSCNSDCIICPRDHHTRKIGFMNFLLYEKLIKEISGVKEKVNRVHLHNFGEPMLDKKLEQRIRLAKNYGIKHTYFVTNASLLTGERSRHIIEAGLDEFKVSFYGADSQTYNRIMKGMDFDKSLENVKKFFKIRKSMGQKRPNVIIQYIPMEDNGFKTDEFYNLMKPIIDEDIGDELLVFSLHNYGGGRDYVKADKITGICPLPWSTMVILNDGKVVLCSLDYNGMNVVGDVNKNTIKEIWNGVRYGRVRDSFKKLRYDAYPVCGKCTVTGE